MDFPQIWLGWNVRWMPIINLKASSLLPEIQLSGTPGDPNWCQMWSTVKPNLGLHAVFWSTTTVEEQFMNQQLIQDSFSLIQKVQTGLIILCPEIRIVHQILLQSSQSPIIQLIRLIRSVSSYITMHQQNISPTSVSQILIYSKLSSTTNKHEIVMIVNHKLSWSWTHSGFHSITNSYTCVRIRHEVWFILDCILQQTSIKA